MSYIPIIPHVPVPEPSPRARRLAIEVDATIERFEREQGALEEEDVRQALRIVESSMGSSSARSDAATRLGVVAAIGLGVLMIGLIVSRGGLASVAGRPVAGLVLFGLLTFGVIAAVNASRRR